MVNGIAVINMFSCLQRWPVEIKLINLPKWFKSFAGGMSLDNPTCFTMRGSHKFSFLSNIGHYTPTNGKFMALCVDAYTDFRL